MRANVDDVVLVSEQELTEGLRMLYTRAKLACEAGAAAGVAALLSGRVDVSGCRGVAVIVSGGNIDPALAAKVLA